MFYIGVSPVVLEPQFLIKSPVYILFCSSFATSISTIIYWWRHRDAHEDDVT